MQQTVKDDILNIFGLSNDYRRKVRKPSEVTEFYLEQIFENDFKIGAFETIYSDEAVALAKQLDDQIARGDWLGPFHGIPFVLKDICDVKGKITKCGSLQYSERVSKSTALIAKRLISAGGILLGKSKTVEFAFGGWGTNQRMGTPWNPWDKDQHRVCGGSSSGSAAALAANMAVCAIGTDTGGSVRLPAAFCGLTGLKVRKGLLPTNGIMPLSHTLDTPGPIARTVVDTAIMLETLKGMAGKEIEHKVKVLMQSSDLMKKSLGKFQIGVINNCSRKKCSSEVLFFYDKIVDTLASLGARIEEFKPNIEFSDISKKMSDIIAVEAYFHHGHLYENPVSLMDDDVRQRVLKVRNYSANSYLALLRDREKEKKKFLSLFKKFDLLLTPTTMDEAPLVRKVDQEITPGHFTRPANYLDLCALALPMGLSSNGLPLSLQICGRRSSESEVIRMGFVIESLLT